MYRYEGHTVEAPARYGTIPVKQVTGICGDGDFWATPQDQRRQPDCGGDNGPVRKDYTSYTCVNDYGATCGGNISGQPGNAPRNTELHFDGKRAPVSM